MAEQAKKTGSPELTPERFTGLKLEKAKTTAAGLPAVFSAVAHIMDEMDPMRAAKVMFELNQMGGIDCPGCAWPDPQKHRSKLGEYCENGAKAIAEEATTKKLGPDFFAEYSIADLSSQSDYWIGKRGRITHPMFKPVGATHYEAIPWDMAFQKIAKHLNGLPSPDRAVFYTSGRTSNEAAFMYQLFVRMYGTNNLPDCSNMCHESSGVALSETQGIGKGSVTLEDFYESEVIMVIGQNPGTNHPRMLNALKRAKKNGAKIITINPLPETGLLKFKDPQSVEDMVGSGTELTDLFLQVRINGDVALLKGIMKLMKLREIEQGGVLDWQFVKNKTKGFELFYDHLDQYNLQRLSEECGIATHQMQEAADLLSKSSKIIACWAMGLTQHKNGVENIQEVVNLLLMKGSIGKPGAGTCPVRGHSNVQGDRTMGIWEKPKAAFLNALQSEFKFDPPRSHGLDVVDSIKKMHDNPGMVFFAMGGNFLSASPDTSYTAEALKNCALTVHVSTKLNRSHLVCGKEAIILPSLGRSDLDIQSGEPQFVTVENSMGIVHSSRGRLKPVSDQLKSEPAIVAGLAKATLGAASSVSWDALASNYDLIRDKIAAVIPGFEHYNERVRQPSGFYLPNEARDQSFKSLDGKARFKQIALPKLQLSEGELLMTTVRTHDQFNTTIYGLNDRYRGIFNERRVVLLNEQDMDHLQLQRGDVVDLWSDFNGRKRCAPSFLVVQYQVPPKCAVTYFPETNVLVPIDSVAEKSNTPTSKSVVITLEKVHV